MILCLGSSFPHLLDAKERLNVMRTFARLLAPGGTLVLDQRNFDAIRAGTYINPSRLYYAGTGVKVSPTLRDGICTFQYSFADGAVFHLSVADLSIDEMQNLFLKSGFRKVQTYGDFDPDFALEDVGFLIHVATL
jgi:glycine/sarcosine N-methyltransferase